MASRTITSNQSGPTLPGATTPLFIKTETTFTPDKNGNPIRGTVITKLLYTPNGSDFFVAATSSKGGAPGSWELKKYTPAEIFNTGIAQFVQPDGTILGPTAALSLNTQNGIMYQAAQNSIIQSANNSGIKGGYQAPLAHRLQNTTPTSPQKPQVGGNPDQPGAGENPDQQNKPNAPDIPDSFTLSPEKEQLQNPNQLKLAPPNGIKYPINAISGDVIQFQAVKIIRSEFKADLKSLSQFSFPEPTYESVDGPVYLPTQSPINDQNSVGWGPDNMDPLSAFAFGLSYDLIKSATDPNIDVGTTARSAIDKVMIAAKTHSSRISKSLAGAAAGVNNILARTDSVIFNPSLELLFDAPQLRPFTFTFKLSAREQGEADVIKSIIKYFKYHMAVRREADKIFLRAPHVFTIQYMTRSSDGRLTPHQSINQITGSGNKKACALTNCSVDYTPLGSYMTYNDPQRTMVSYTISLQFTEITPIYDTDYSEADHPIGY